MSRFGERLELPLASEQPVEAVCPRTGDRYRLTGQQLQLIEHRLMEFIDLKSQYTALRDNINARIQRVLDHG
ncbi:hypothetical protein, partial [Klebsiella pneumoniae]|uniref:hypothetical protein n=1 Tax=Klebsiella pneumoniae TaxID=573 RepID=UPI0027310822